MLGYILIVAIALIGGLSYEQINGSQKNKKIYLSIVFGGMLLFALLRGYDVGIDYNNRVREMYIIFERNFEYMLLFGQQENEHLYFIIMWLISRVVPSPWVVNSVMDCFVLITFAWFFYRYSKDVTISTIMFLAFAFTAELNITRQYVAAALLLIALHYLIQKRPWIALIPLICSVSIHNSAILMFAIYIIYVVGYKVTRGKLLLYLATAVAAFVLFDPALELFLTLFPRYSYALGESFVGNSGFSVKWLCVYLVLFAGVYITTPVGNKRGVLAPVWEKISSLIPVEKLISSMEAIIERISSLIPVGTLVDGLHSVNERVCSLILVKKICSSLTFVKDHVQIFCQKLTSALTSVKARVGSFAPVRTIVSGVTSVKEWVGTLVPIKLASGTSKESEEETLTGVVALGFILYATMAMLKSKMWFVQRMQVYFMFGYCMVISEFLPKLKLSSKVKFVLSVAIKVAVVFWGISEFSKDPHGLLPYTFIWEQG